MAENEEKSELHVQVRCMVCGYKFDSKYDFLPEVGTFKVGDVHRNYIYCPRCKKRVDARVVSVR